MGQNPTARLRGTSLPGSIRQVHSPIVPGAEPMCTGAEPMCTGPGPFGAPAARTGGDAPSCGAEGR